MNQLGADRLAKQIEFIQGVPDRGFIMDLFFGSQTLDWVDFLGEHRHTFRDEPPANQTAECGTAACFAGWWCVSEPDDWISIDSLPALRTAPDHPPDFNAESTYRDVGNYVGMTTADARLICCPDNYSAEHPTKQEVLERAIMLAKDNYGWDVTQLPARKVA